MKRIKVLFVLDNFLDPHAGTEGQLWLLLSRLDRARYEPSILLLRPSPFFERNLRDIPIKLLDIRSLRSVRSLWRIVCAVLWAKRAGFRVAHIFFNDSAIVFPIPLRLAGVKVIVSRRDLGFWYSRFNLPLLRLNSLFVNVMVANCEAVRQAVQEREWFSAAKGRVIYNGVAPKDAGNGCEVREVLGLAADTALVVIVANLRPLKRLDDAVRAIATVAARNAALHLVVVGADCEGTQHSSHRAELEALAVALNVADRVHFLGKMDNPQPIIDQASICMLCSETEGLSNAVIEYMVAGKPVVCTAVGGNGELIVDGYNGYTVRPGDVQTMAIRLDALLKSPGQCAIFGARSVARARDMFAASTMQHAYEELYSTLHGGANE